MQTLAMNDSFMHELTMDELNLVAGGRVEFNWSAAGVGAAIAGVGVAAASAPALPAMAAVGGAAWLFGTVF